MVLLVGAGLLTRNFARLAGADLGFEPENLIKVSVDLGRPNAYNSKYYTCDLDRSVPLLWNRCPPDRDAMARFYDQVVERVMRVPGVRSAAITDLAPLVDVGGYYPLRIPGTTNPMAPSGDGSGGDVGESEPEVILGNTDGRVVGLGFFKTMGMRIVSGRDFQAGDPPGGLPGWSGVAVVNERLASRAWPGESALGKRVGYYSGGRWMTVIGVVEDAQQHTLSHRVKFNDEGLESRVYQLGHAANMDLMVRTASDPNAFIESIREAVLELDPGLPTGAIATAEELAGNSNAAPRFYALVVGVFAGFALLLTAVGLYGLVSFTVGRRTKEIGLRMALGAHQGDIRTMAMGHSAKSVALGIALGVAGALALTNVLENFLYGMDAVDPLTYVVVALVLAGVAAGASYVPASRASRMNPTEALRYD